MNIMLQKLNDKERSNYDAVAFQVNNILSSPANNDCDIYDWLKQEKNSLIEISLYKDTPCAVYLADDQFYGDNKKAQELLDKYAGKGHIPLKGREVVKFDQEIGKAYDLETGKYIETNRGTIHYSKDGAHIVPTKSIP